MRPNVMATIGAPVSVLRKDEGPEPGQHNVVNDADLWEQSLIGGFWGELTRAISRRRPIERRARVARAHYHGQYPDGLQTDDPEDSELFFQRTREVVAYGTAKIMQMISPPHEDIWDLQSPQNPVTGPRSLEGQKPNGDEGSDAYKQIEQEIDKRKTIMRDQFVDMDFDNLKHDLAFQLALYGTAFFFGPIKKDDPRLVWNSETGEWSKDEEAADSWAPAWKNLRFWDVFLDPECIKNDLSDCEFFFVKHLMTRHQLRQLARDPSFDANAIEDVLEDIADAFVGAGPAAMSYEIYDPHSDSVVSAIGRTFMNRYAIWMRVGVLGKEELEKLPDHYKRVFEKNGDISRLEGAIFETWFCGEKIIRMKAREFQPDKLPLEVVPLELMDGSPYGRGWAEMVEAIQRSQNSLTRSMQDTLRHASGYQAVVDMAQIPVGTDLSIRGRKTWMTRSVEGHGRGRPVEFQIIPTNQADMIAALEFWEKMVPIVTSMPRMNPQDMGSGVRTEGMLESQLSAMEAFIKLTIGNIDRYFMKPLVQGLFLWNKVYDTENPITYNCRPVATGVLGAIRREIVGRKAAALMEDLSKIGAGDAVDDFELMRMRTQGLGMDGTRLVLSPQALVHKRAAAAQQKRLDAMAEARGNAEGQDRVRAETSVRDALVSAIGNIPDPNNPVWAPAMMKLYESVGEVDPVIATALTVWSRKVALDFQRIGAANPVELQTLSKGFTTTNPAEVEPGPLRQAAAHGQPIGDTSNAGGPPMTTLPPGANPQNQQFEQGSAAAAPPNIPIPQSPSTAAVPGQ